MLPVHWIHISEGTINTVSSVCLCFDPVFHTRPHMEFSTCVSMWMFKTFWILEEFGFLIFRLGDVQPVGPLEKYLKHVDRHSRTCTLSHFLSTPEPENKCLHAQS